jgi:N-acylneuraminate cytidylyltransferase
MTALIVIPARGGSKRIPRKNIRPFMGTPMIAWSIKAALAVEGLTAVIVSTDDDEIAAVARDHGAQVPFRRPAALADDHTGTVEVVAHAIEAYTTPQARPDWVCCLYATAPFVTPDDLTRGLDVIRGGDADYAFPVTAFEYPIQRALRLTDNGGVEPFQPECLAARSQDLEPAYHDAGQFYWGRSDAWLANRPVFGPRSLPLILPRHRVQDIDTEEDWIMAERLFASDRDTAPFP